MISFFQVQDHALWKKCSYTDLPNILKCYNSNNSLVYFFQSVVLGDKCEAELWVCFNPAFYKDRVSHNVDEVTMIQPLLIYHAVIFFQLCIFEQWLIHLDLHWN